MSTDAFLYDNQTTELYLSYPRDNLEGQEWLHVV